MSQFEDENDIGLNDDLEGEDLDIGEQEEKPEGKIPRKMAEKEFNSWAEHLRLDTDIDEMDAEEKTDFLVMKKKFVYNLMNGFTHTEENGDLVLKLIEPVAGKTTMVFRKKFKGVAFVKMDQYKEHQAVHKTLAFLAAWTVWKPTDIVKLDAVDTWFGMKMVSLFFGA